MLLPATEAETAAQTPGRPAHRHPGRLDQKGTGSAHGIDEGSAPGRHFRPAGAHENSGGQGLFDRRFKRTDPVAAPVQRRSGKVDAHRDPLPLRKHVDAQVRFLQIDGRTFSGGGAKLIHNGVLDLERGKMGVPEGGMTTDEGHGKRSAGVQVLPPQNPARARIQCFRRSRFEISELQQNMLRESGPEADPVAGFERAAEADPARTAL